MSSPQTPSTTNPLTQNPARSTRRFSLSRFDKTVLLVSVILVAFIGLTILLGDRVGVTLDRVGPLGLARSTEPILIQFSETMNRDSLPAHLRVVEIKPGTQPENFQESDTIASVAGDIHWNGKTLLFQPKSALQPGAFYAVILDKGVVSDTGRAVLAEYRYGFEVRHPRVAYLAPATGTPYNIWIADPTDLSSAKQITFSPSGIFNYSVSPDGSKIAFAERNTNTGTSDIKLLDLDTNALQQLTNCQDADCTTPVWRPDGQVIGYERVELNSTFTQVGVSPTRIWLLDLTSTPPSTRPLFSDSQMLGYGLQWSDDGNRITVFDYNSQGILFHQFNPDSTIVIPSRYGSAGWLSPDGTRVIYPEVLLQTSEARSYLQLVDLKTQQIKALTSPDDPIDDDTAAWSPDGKMLAIGRRYLDDRFTRGKQLYLMNPEDSSVQAVLVDPQYQIGSFVWDPNGTQLLLQRFPDPVAMGDPNNPGKPEVWTVDVTTKALTKIADDAFLPRWVP
ncbi:MAG: Ig-like domain-containing protein [Chloroflexota bacterium]